MEYKEIISNCKSAYDNKDLCLAYQYWCNMFDMLDSKLEGINDDRIRFNIYTDFHNAMNNFSDKMVYDITDYGKRVAYREMGLL